MSPQSAMWGPVRPRPSDPHAAVLILTNGAVRALPEAGGHCSLDAGWPDLQQRQDRYRMPLAACSRVFEKCPLARRPVSGSV